MTFWNPKFVSEKDLKNSVPYALTQPKGWLDEEEKNHPNGQKCNETWGLIHITLTYLGYRWTLTKYNEQIGNTNQLVDTQLRGVELEDIFLFVQRFDCELQHKKGTKLSSSANIIIKSTVSTDRTVMMALLQPDQLLLETLDLLFLLIHMTGYW